MTAASSFFGDRDDAELLVAFAGLRDRNVSPPDGLGERCLDGVEAVITAQDLAEFGTAVLVKEFLGPVIDLFAFMLGFEEQGEDHG